MPLGLVFRRAVLWHEGREYVFRQMTEFERNPSQLLWTFCCPNAKFRAIQVEVRGRNGFIHHLPYSRADCSGQFEVVNDSLAIASMKLLFPGRTDEELITDTGAVLEMTGDYD
jgi:hypothetical protein